MSCGRAKAGGNLAEEKKLLSLAWREVGGGLGSLPEAGGGVDESLVLLLPVLEKEENRPCRGEGKLTAGAVGVAEEEMLPTMLLIEVQAAGKGGYCCCCWDCGGGERETFCRKEKGREGDVAGFGEVAG
uniref:Uncharacterized protein n=1 Tax=Populus alba TaxID=43335 RepID=A0A4U5NA08_POPAL|nr:hypothetical protein D5086_0000269190 [Populus alba]